MTKSEIIAELRRSAIEDEYPLHRTRHSALVAVNRWLEPQEWIWGLRGTDDIRTFFLLVAEAMES